MIAWLKRYLARDASVDTGPRFEWLADDAKWRSAADYPPPAGAPLVGRGRRARSLLNPADAASGSAVAAGRAANAVNVAVPAPRRAAQVVGEPELTLTYSGTGAAPTATSFAQIVDETRGVVVGNQVHADPGHARRQAAHDQRPLEGDRGEPHAAVASSRCRSSAAARSTARCARPRTIRSPRPASSIPTVGAGAGERRRRRAAAAPAAACRGAAS